MPLIENFKGILPVRVDADTAAWHPHTLAIAVSGPNDEVWSPEKLIEVAQECAKAFYDSFNTIEFLWGGFFEDWAIDLISRDGAAGMIGVSDGDRQIIGGRYLARIVLPSALFAAAPNPRGNQSGSNHPIEGLAQEVLKSHVYLMHRFLVGFHAQDRRVTQTDLNLAQNDLRPLIKNILHLTAVDQKGASVSERNDESAVRFVELCIEQGPRYLGQLTIDPTNKKSGERMMALGATNRMTYGKLKASELFASLAAEFDVLADAWERARLIRIGEQSARRAGAHGSMTVEVALDQPGLSEQELQRIAGVSTRQPSLQMIADVARRHEFDITICHPTLQSLKPIAVAMMAVSAFERRAEVPSRDTIEGVIAHHAIANMATNLFATEAAENGFGRDWPVKKLKALSTRLVPPLPRVLPIMASKAGYLF